MTWKDLKEAIEAEGVKDDDHIAYIDISGSETIQAKKDEYGEWGITST